MPLKINWNNIAELTISLLLACASIAALGFGIRYAFLLLKHLFIVLVALLMTVFEKGKQMRPQTQLTAMLDDRGAALKEVREPIKGPTSNIDDDYDRLADSREDFLKENNPGL